jgi:hypothetical protein
MVPGDAVMATDAKRTLDAPACGAGTSAAISATPTNAATDTTPIRRTPTVEVFIVFIRGL